MKFYLHFNLLMDRSPGFGSWACNHALFTLGFPPATDLSVLNLNCCTLKLAGPFYKKYHIAL